MHAPGSPWGGVLVGMAVAALLAVGCGKNKPATEAPADAAAASEPAAEHMEKAEDGGGAWDDPLADAQAELEGYEDALLATGVELPGDVTQARADAGKASVAAQAGADATTDRCQRRCDLATNICELRGRICAMADEHAGQARYAKVCGRATLDCDRATEACDGCEG